MSKIHETEQPAEWTGIPDMPARRILFGQKPEEPEQEAGDETPASSNDTGSGRYSVTVPLAQWDYDHIVSAIVTAEYPADRMQAIQNNFLRALRGDAGAKSGDYLEEFNDMQNWRDLAKATAHEVLGQ